MKKQRAELLLEKAPFRFAKTMPEKPHWYTLRKDWKSDEQFNDLVQFIRDNGVTEKFQNRDYIYYYHKGYKYWTMGAPVDETILINKAKV